jgi:ADP-ribose pyrophosphatase YjhB (NUDIX family)
VGNGMGGHLVSVAGLAADPDGRWLLVRPIGGGAWQLPGGTVPAGESPSLTCERRARDSLGLNLAAGRLLVVTWTPPVGVDGRATLTLIFDLGELPERPRIRLSGSWRDWCWATPDQAAHLLHPQITRQLQRHAIPTAVYVEQGPARPATKPDALTRNSPQASARVAPDSQDAARIVADAIGRTGGPTRGHLRATDRPTSATAHAEPGTQ